MVRYTYTKIVNTDKLDVEIKELGLPYAYLDTSAPDQLYIWMNQGLSDVQEQILTHKINAHSPTIMISAAEMIKEKIIKAMDFGRGLMAEYGASNILSGYTVEQIQQIMDKTARVQVALNTGSLYVALTELEQIEIDGVLITEEKIAVFRHKIQDYLNIPRT